MSKQAFDKMMAQLPPTDRERIHQAAMAYGLDFDSPEWIPFAVTQNGLHQTEKVLSKLNTFSYWKNAVLGLTITVTVALIGVGFLAYSAGKKSSSIRAWVETEDAQAILNCTVPGWQKVPQSGNTDVYCYPFAALQNERPKNEERWWYKLP